MNRSVVFCFVAMMSLLQSVRAIAQTDSASRAVSDCIQQLSAIRSGSIRYTISEKTGEHALARTDTLIFSFAGLGDSVHQLFVNERGGMLHIYDDTTLYSIDRQRANFSKVALNGASAIRRIAANLPGTIVNNGEVLRGYLKRGIAKILPGDTSMNGQTCLTLEIHDRAADPSNKSVQNIWVRYYITTDGLLAGYSIHRENAGQHLYQDVRILHASYNSSIRPELQKFIALTKLKIQSFKQTSPTAQAAEAMLENGATAPDFAGVTFDGDTLDLYAQHSKLILLDFWFANCMPCRNLTPFLRSMKEKYASKGLLVLGVDPYDNDEPRVRGVSKLLQVNYPEMLLPHQVAADYGITAYPTLYLLDSEKRIVHVQEGYSKYREEELEKAIQTALNITAQ